MRTARLAARFALAAALLLAISGTLIAWRLLHPGLRPALNPDVSQATIGATICVSGWTKTVRPASAVARRLKTALVAVQGDDAVIGDYVLDHIVPLALGGAAREPSNLMLQPIAEGRIKDRIELKLHCLVCTGVVSLDDAQRAIGTDRQLVPQLQAKADHHRSG
jgi:hypothetical protein